MLKGGTFHVHFSRENVSLLQSHRHGCPVLCTLTADDPTTLKVTTQLGRKTEMRDWLIRANCFVESFIATDLLT